MVAFRSFLLRYLSVYFSPLRYFFTPNPAFEQSRKIQKQSWLSREEFNHDAQGRVGNNQSCNMDGRIRSYAISGRRNRSENRSGATRGSGRVQSPSTIPRLTRPCESPRGKNPFYEVPARCVQNHHAVATVCPPHSEPGRQRIPHWKKANPRHLRQSGGKRPFPGDAGKATIAPRDFCATGNGRTPQRTVVHPKRLPRLACQSQRTPAPAKSLSATVLYATPDENAPARRAKRFPSRNRPIPVATPDNAKTALHPVPAPHGVPRHATDAEE